MRKRRILKAITGTTANIKTMAKVELQDRAGKAQTTDVVWVTHAGVIRAVQFMVASGGVHIRDAAQWPKDAPEPGGWTSLSF